MRSGKCGVMWTRIGVMALCGAALLAIGANPRYLEELRIGGGLGEAVDGGADFEQDGDIYTDGEIGIGAGKVYRIGGAQISRSDLSDGVPDGSGSGNTLRWNGSAWIENTGLKHDGTDLTLLSTGKIKPSADATNAVQFAKSDGTVIGVVDTTNSRFGWGTTTPGLKAVFQAGAGDQIGLGLRSTDYGMALSDTSGNLDFVVLRSAALNHVYLGDIDNNSASAIIRAGGADCVSVVPGGNTTIAGDLYVDGGDIGLTADTDLIGLAVNTLTIRGQGRQALNSITTDVSDGLGLAGETEGSSTGEQSKAGDGYTQVWSNAVVVNNARAVFVVQAEAKNVDDEAASDGNVRVVLATTDVGTTNATGVAFLDGEWSDAGTMRPLSGSIHGTTGTYTKYRYIIIPYSLTAGTTYYLNISIEGETDGSDESTCYIKNMYTMVNS